MCKRARASQHGVTVHMACVYVCVYIRITYHPFKLCISWACVIFYVRTLEFSDNEYVICKRDHFGMKPEPELPRNHSHRRALRRILPAYAMKHAFRGIARFPSSSAGNCISRRKSEINAENLSTIVRYRHAREESANLSLELYNSVLSDKRKEQLENSIAPRPRRIRVTANVIIDVSIS